MTFKQLPYLLAIASEGSLSKAAKKLNISQPALSSFLKQLEEQTSLPMFTIVKNQYELTEAGRLMAQSHQKILNLYAQMKLQIQELQTGDQKYPSVLRVGTTPHIDAACITEAWLKFRRDYPSVELNIQNMKSHFLRAALERGELDLVIGPLMEIESPLFLSCPIFYEHMVAVIPDSFSLPRSLQSQDFELPFVSLTDLAEYPFIFREPASILGMLQRSLWSTARRYPRVLAQCGSYPMFQAMIMKENGISIMPYRMVPENPHLHCYRLREDINYTVGLLMPHDTSIRSIAFSWAQYIAEEFKKQKNIYLYDSSLSSPGAPLRKEPAPISDPKNDHLSPSPSIRLDFGRQKVLDTTMLEYFYVTVNCGSISLAANTLYLSQPYLSRRLSALEKEIGASLLNRGHDGIELTAAGKIYLHFAEQILTEQELTHHRFCDFRSHKS